MDTSNSLVLETRNLSKAYKGVQALKDFNLKLTPGILGLLGPNEAGRCVYRDGGVDGFPPLTSPSPPLTRSQ